MTLNLSLLYVSFGLSVLVLGLSIYLIWLMRSLIKLRKQLGVEHQPQNLEEILNAMVSKLKGLDEQLQSTKADLNYTQDQTGLSVKKVGLVKFNSFADEGGNLSFSVALLDSKNSGVAITSLNGRTQNRVYAKTITESVGEASLNEEEKQAVMLAVTEHKNQSKISHTNS